jgi:hypothetical protein
MAASVAGRGGQVAAGAGVFWVALPAAPPAPVVRTAGTAARGGALPPSGLYLSRSARLAARVAFFFAALVAAAAVVVLLGSHHAEAAVAPAGKAVPGAGRGSSIRVVPGAGRTLTAAPTPVRRTSRNVVTGATGALTRETQALGPVVQQLAPATSPVTTPVGQALRRIVPLGPGALRPVAQLLGPVPQYLAQLYGPVLTPSTRSETGSRPIGAPGVSSYVADRAGPPTAPSSVVAPGNPSVKGSPTPSAGSNHPALDSRGTYSHERPGLPAASDPFGGATAPTPVGSGGAGHGASGLLASLLSSWRSLGLLIVLVGLIALWSAGRPAARPEVSPA